MPHSVWGFLHIFRFSCEDEVQTFAPKKYICDENAILTAIPWKNIFYDDDMEIDVVFCCFYMIMHMVVLISITGSISHWLTWARDILIYLCIMDQDDPWYCNNYTPFFYFIISHFHLSIIISLWLYILMVTKLTS